VVVADFQGYVHWLDKTTGELVARERMDKKRITNAPVAVGDTVVVLSDDGKLAAFRATPAPQPPTAATPAAPLTAAPPAAAPPEAAPPATAPAAPPTPAVPPAPVAPDATPPTPPPTP
jgi:hypothetical protein